MSGHSFDTGLSQPQRTTLRQGALEVLAPLRRPNGYLADVLAFGGIVRSYTDDPDIEFLMKAMGRTPSIAVQLGTRDFETLAIGGKQAKSEVQLLLYFATQHSRDSLEGRHEADVVARADAHADPGLDIMMEHAIELMHGTYPTLLSTTVKQIRIKREEELATLPPMTIWLQTYAVTLQTYTGSKEFRTADQLLTSIGWRTTTDPNEASRPAPATASTTIDADTDTDF